MASSGDSAPLPRKSRRQRHGYTLAVLVSAAAAAGALGLALGWFSPTPAQEREQSGVLLHLDSRVGEQAPAFTLTDSEGVAHTVSPGQGRPTVLLFHMGTR